MSGVNYMGGSRNAHRKKDLRYREDLSGTPGFRPAQPAKSTGLKRTHSSRGRGLAEYDRNQNSPEFPFAFAPSSHPPRPKALELCDDVESFDQEAYELQQRCQQTLREEAASRERVMKSSLEMERDDRDLTDRRAREALLNTPNWSETSNPQPPRAQTIQPALKRSSAPQNQTRAQLDTKFSKLFIPRPRRGSATSAFGRPSPPPPPVTSKPRYQARRARSPTEVDELQELEAILRAPAPSGAADYSWYPGAPHEEGGQFGHPLAAEASRFFRVEAPQPPPPFNDTHDGHLGSEPMDISSDRDEDEDREILQFSQDGPRPPFSFSFSKPDTSQAPSSSNTAATVGSSSTLTAISTPAGLNAHPLPGASPSTLAQLPVPHPQPQPPPAPVEDPNAPFYLSTSSLAYWNSLASSMNLPPLSPSFVDPEYVGWTGPCCATRRQREDLKEVFLFDAFEVVDLEPEEGEGEELVTQERMGVGCRGVRREEEGRFDRMMLNVGWEGWDEGAEVGEDEEEDDGEDPGELKEEEQLWTFAVESREPKAAPIILCPPTPSPISARSTSPPPISAPAATTLTAITDAGASSPPASTFDMIDLGLSLSSAEGETKRAIASDSTHDRSSSPDPLVPKKRKMYDRRVKMETDV
ncbi:hypothetical protein BCR35DRAFT_355341 [Leucosporidium creatinivorum]|uniref:Uncharacterized protein n=1 Tax=Leucosporidium creatinivorum TaxID=106004 RepID=A0A1Y2DIT2_9BASI|nr:hypothetical protein BCR35DRAFT_355341 [Leucosporidium creatinivorum]